MMLNQFIQFTQSVAPDGVLNPYLESNAREFCSSGAALPDKWKVNIDFWATVAGLDEQCKKELLEMAEYVESDSNLSFLWFHCSRLVYGNNLLYPKGSILRWPAFDRLFNGQGRLFLLLIALSAVPQIRKIHHSMGIPDEITTHTCRDIASRNEITREFGDNSNGISTTCVAWLRMHASGELFQLGRLQFHPRIVSHPIRVYRHKTNGEVIIVPEGGYRFTKEGYFDGAGHTLDENGWFSVLDIRGNSLRVTPFSKNGLARKQPITLCLDEWSLAADASSTVMNTHIPRGGKLSVPEWYDSVRRGFEFFRTYRPAAAPFAACFCTSWLFDPRLQELLPEDSGLVTLQNNVNLFALCSARDRSGYTFIFGENDVDIAQAPCKTSLQQAVIDYAAKGGKLSGGGMFLFEDQVVNTV